MRRTMVVAGGVVLGVGLLAGPAAAQEAELTLESVQANIDIIFLMMAAALVLLMHPGFALLESGLGRAKNSAHIIMKNLMTLTLGVVSYYAVGFALMYGTQVGGFIGTDGFFLQGLASYEPVTGGSLSADFLFQAMFAATAATIISGACAERMKFGPYIVVILVVTAVIYPIVGAWKWGGGWLAELGFLDFAGSTIVHMTGGIAAFMGAAILGPRLGKFAADGTPRALLGHSIPLAMLGVLLLFFGWFGFNGGSVLIADGPVVASVLLATVLAGAIGGVAAALMTRVRYGKYDVAMTGNGILAGLVGVTAGADVLDNLGALGVGLAAGILVTLVVPLVDRIRVDDPVGAVAVHGACGALGTVWVGLAHSTEGLLYGGGAGLLGVQAIGVASVAAFVAATSGLVFFGLKATVGIRVTETEEIEGLDLHEHGSYGYPELALGTQAYPAGPRFGEGAAPAPAAAGTAVQAQAILQQ
ncbi:MAG: ammonium transporter [Nitriliruptorales bacterium]|nr:ammonium transporter [Nitriliruptorales bacterium]